MSTIPEVWDVEKLIDTVKDVAHESPDYVYDYATEGIGRACTYFKKSGTPGCIVGHALHRMGVTLDDMMYEDETGCDRNYNEEHTITDLVNALDLPIGPHQLEWLAAVQGKQDNRQPWGQAVIEATEVDNDS
jgi:hypothetical protein